jgi:hypothetical protein
MPRSDFRGTDFRRSSWIEEKERVDTLVDPVELLSSSHMPVAPRVDVPRGSLPSVDPEAQVQWFSRMPEDEPVTSVDVDVFWDEGNDTEPTLVLERYTHGMQGRGARGE